MVTANWRKNWPRDAAQEGGRHEHREEHQATAMTGPVTSSMALRAASRGATPCSSQRSMFSTTTMASSTTMPIASTRPNSERLLSEKPSAAMTAKVPMMATGTAISGMIAARQFCRKTSTTRATRIDGVAERVEDLVDRLADEGRGVVNDLVIQRRRGSGSSAPSSCRRPARRSPGRWSREAGRWSGPPRACRRACRTARTAANRARRAADVAEADDAGRPGGSGRGGRPLVLRSRCRAVLPVVAAALLPAALLAPRRWPLPALRMMSANCSGSVSRPRVLMVSWNCWPLGTGSWPIWPAATCRFCWAMAATTSAAREPQGGQLVGIEPGPQAVVALAEVGDVGHARQPAQLVADVDRGVVAQEVAS